MQEAAAHGARTSQPQEDGVEKQAHAISPAGLSTIDVIGEAEASGILDAFARQITRAEQRIDGKEMEFSLGGETARDRSRDARSIREIVGRALRQWLHIAS